MAIIQHGERAGGMPDPDGPASAERFDIVVVGGFGHVGLPLAVSLASRDRRVCALDINARVGEEIARGIVPFTEDGCERALRAALEAKTFHISLDERVISQADTVIIIIGTPVDRHLNPEFDPLWRVLDSIAKYLMDGQLVILRSTVYPGTTDRLNRTLLEMGKDIDLAYCPERISEGRAMEELASLPQLISAYSESGYRRCRDLFAPLTTDVVQLTPLEAELAKLFSNTWRYTLFATANQFFMLANDHGVDFHRIHHAMTWNYPRLKDIPKPGFAAGPCLFKDAMQLAAFNNYRFSLGHAAMLVNEGLPNYVVDRLKMRFDLSQLVCGILGMAFKANSDDKRESLSYKLKKVLQFESRSVLCSDEHIRESGFVSADELIERSDIVIVGAPHREYQSIALPADKVSVDIWNIWGRGCIL
jgi:UDP-N-acetyl-D-mannosaminuronic acid dehydrogenase